MSEPVERRLGEAIRLGAPNRGLLEAALAEIVVLTGRLERAEQGHECRRLCAACRQPAHGPVDRVTVAGRVWKRQPDMQPIRRWRRVGGPPPRSWQGQFMAALDQLAGHKEQQ